MADTLEQLIMALAQADSAVAGSDPYASPQNAVDSIRWDPNQYGIGENAVASGLKGLLSGVFGAAGTDYKQRAAAEYKDVLSGKVKAPSVLPEELFSKAQNQLGIFKLLKEKDDLDKIEAAEMKRADSEQALKDYETKLGIKERITGGKEKTPIISAGMMDQMAKSKAVIEEAKLLAQEIDQIGPSWADLTASKFFSGMDKNGVGLALKNAADKLARARTGAAMNDSEIQLYNQLLGGDLTASPPQVAKLLRKLAQAESRMTQSQLDFYDKASSPKEMRALFDFAEVQEAAPREISLDAFLQQGGTVDALAAEKARRAGGARNGS